MTKQTGRISFFSVEGLPAGVKAKHLAVGHPPAEAQCNDHVTGPCVAASHHHLV